MADDREIRLEGLSLWVSGGALAALLVAAFWVGRVTAPSSAPGAAPPGPVDRVEEVVVDAEAKGNFFDAPGGTGRDEPGREARQGAPAPPAAPPVGPGPWFVQVFAGRDREAAQQLVGALRSKGWPVKVESQREGSGALYRVRVGGYPTREAADDAVRRLRADGQGGAWVTKVAP